MIECLHARFRDLPKISPVLVQRHAKISFEAAVVVYDKIQVLRDQEGLNRKKWSRIK